MAASAPAFADEEELRSVGSAGSRSFGGDAAGESPQVIARKYAVAVGKMAAGVCRFVFEDVLQCGCQAIWLCKQWKMITLYTKAFTMASIGSGLFLSFAVPLNEYLQIRKLRSEAGESADALTATGADGEFDDQEAYRVLQSIEPDDVVSKEDKKSVRNMFPANVTVSQFLSVTKGHGRRAHWAMVASALLFWGYMATYPKIFDDKITCHGTPPAMGLQIFFGLFVFDVVLQVWVLIHTKVGYNMLVNNIFGFIGGVMFSLLGRFDTYGDVSFTYKLIKCEPITWFSIYGNVFTLPFQLEYFAIFALAVGVLCMQALPGLYFLCAKQRLPMAMKFNEFNLVLSVMALETGTGED